MITNRLVCLVTIPLLALACASQPTTPAAEPQPTEEPSATADASEDSHRNTLKWSTASEVDNFGFDIYRAESENGPFVRLNDTPIPGAGTSDVPTYYEYIDDTIDPYRGYHYYIESISISGERERFTPTNYAKPKIESTDAENKD